VPEQQHALASLRRVIANDGHAAAHQTLGQYRRALLAHLDQLAASIDRSAGGSNHAGNASATTAGPRLHDQALQGKDPAARAGGYPPRTGVGNTRG
jgi:hypothetical protein